MNAHARIFMDETPLAMRRALTDALAVYGNEDTRMAEGAVDAIIERRAAFWTTSSYHNAITSSLPHVLNAGVDIQRAIEDGYDDRYFGCDVQRRDRSRLVALDTIVPLNMKAATALSLAYSAKGIWKDEPELLMRSKRDMRPGRAA